MQTNIQTQDDLFNVTESKSPKLLWMERHDVKTRFEEDLNKWHAWIGDHDESLLTQTAYMPKLDGPYFFERDTEQEAICAIAESNGWRLWNEE